MNEYVVVKVLNVLNGERWMIVAHACGPYSRSKAVKERAKLLKERTPEMVCVSVCKMADA